MVDHGAVTTTKQGYFLKLLDYNTYAHSINPLRFRSGNEGAWMFNSIPEILKAVDTDDFSGSSRRAAMTIVRVERVEKVTYEFKEVRL